MTGRLQQSVPLGLKAISSSGLNGTAEAVPYLNPMTQQSCEKERS